MEKNLTFYRAMSIREYQLYERFGKVTRNQEWVESGLEKEHEGVQLAAIKWWVDNGYYGAQLHHLIIAVEGDSKTEFFIPGHIIPKRYVNNDFIDFSRVKVVYDPNGVVSKTPVFLDDLV
jgi:hypothetical protein